VPSKSIDIFNKILSLVIINPTKPNFVSLRSLLNVYEEDYINFLDLIEQLKFTYKIINTLSCFTFQIEFLKYLDKKLKDPSCATNSHSDLEEFINNLEKKIISRDIKISSPIWGIFINNTSLTLGELQIIKRRILTTFKLRILTFNLQPLTFNPFHL